METGCRPSEAAYLVLFNSFRKMSGQPEYDYQALVPPHAAKTRIKYKWGVRRHLNGAIELVKHLHDKADLEHLGGQQLLAKRLYDWFVKRILVDLV